MSSSSCRTVLPLLSGERRGLEEASRDLGACPFTTFFLVTLPQIRAGIYVQYFIDPTIAAVSAATIVAAGLTIVIVDIVIGLDFLSGSD